MDFINAKTALLVAGRAVFCYIDYSCWGLWMEKNMVAVQGYYDGLNIQTLEKIQAKKNQRIIITVMDEFVEPKTILASKSMKGALAEYANPELIEKEKGAWQRAMVKKYGNA